MKTKKTKQVDAAGTTTIVSDEEFKEYLHDQIAQRVKEQAAKTGHALSRAGARHVLNLATELIFRRVVETGYFRFPSGYGSLKLVKLREDAALRTMPGGEQVKPKDHRYKIKYKDGVAVMDMLGTNPHKYQRKTPRPSAFEETGEVTV